MQKVDAVAMESDEQHKLDEHFLESNDEAQQENSQKPSDSLDSPTHLVSAPEVRWVLWVKSLHNLLFRNSDMLNILISGYCIFSTKDNNIQYLLTRHCHFALPYVAYCIPAQKETRLFEMELTQFSEVLVSRVQAWTKKKRKRSGSARKGGRQQRKHRPW